MITLRIDESMETECRLVVARLKEWDSRSWSLTCVGFFMGF